MLTWTLSQGLASMPFLFQISQLSVHMAAVVSTQSDFPQVTSPGAGLCVNPEQVTAICYFSGKMSGGGMGNDTIVKCWGTEQCPSSHIQPLLE